MQGPSGTEGGTGDELVQLRQKIDAVDSQLHDLLMQRTELAVAVGAAKAARQPVSGDSPAEGAKFIRPAREAKILRRLIARHSGKLPKAVIVRMWREMISALLQVEGPFAVAVYAPAGQPGFWDLARDHYGSRVRIVTCSRVDRALSAVMDGSATVAVLPFPREDDSGPWWRRLVGSAQLPHVIARLPFGDPGNQRNPDLQALVVGRTPTEPTDRDHSLLVLEAPEPVSRSTLRQALAGVGFVTSFIHGGRDHQDSDLNLVEVAGYVDGLDPRLGLVAAALGKDARLHSIGSYAEPLTKEELADEPADH
ncbi:chorismate mutase [Dongia sp.]|uniref:chorismate mutase n=1 Tax=Dongia sp. TaxID=1977262 RepID=UPI0035B0191B